VRYEDLEPLTFDEVKVFWPDISEASFAWHQHWLFGVLNNELYAISHAKIRDEFWPTSIYRYGPHGIRQERLPTNTLERGPVPADMEKYVLTRRIYGNVHGSFTPSVSSGLDGTWSDRDRGVLEVMDQPPAHVQHAKVIHSADSDIVAAALVGEAGAEGYDGMLAVMNVIANRANYHSAKFKSVVLARKQFSMFNSGEVDKIVARSKKHPLWFQAKMIVDQVSKGKLPDTVGGAKHYYAQKKVTPSWSGAYPVTRVIGNHTFLK
jgi:hypothetical protein